MEMQVRIGSDGAVSAVHADDLVPVLAAVGVCSVRRASNVEPTPDGRWLAEIVDGPRLGPFSRRDEAIAAEVAWLRESGRA